MKEHRKLMSDDTRIALLEQSIISINETLSRFEKRFDNIDRKLEEMDKKLDIKIDAMHSRIGSNFLWLLGAFSAEFIVMAKGFGWLKGVL